MEKIDFYSLPVEELAKLLNERLQLPNYRADQLFQWVYRYEQKDFLEMTNIGKDLRKSFAEMFYFPEARIKERHISSDGSRKYALEVDNGDLVETVMIQQVKRKTLCVSSQVGCGMACGFCRTATMGFKRNLTTSEIVRQVVAIIKDAKEFGDMFQNIVFMGMGEPLHNFDSVVSALKILKNTHGLAISGRKITVSSVGLVPAIQKFGECGVETNLAISLNATTDEVRSTIMPINRRYPIEVLLQCLKDFPLRKRKRITIEYVMLAGINDTAQDLKRLPKLLSGIKAKINLIPYNINAGLGFSTPTRENLMHWQDQLLKSGIETTIRWSKGQDINAACGQLVTSSTRTRRSRLDLVDVGRLTSNA